MVEVGVHEAKTNLSRLLRRVAAGEEIIITRGRQPVARLVPVAPASEHLGTDRGAIEIAADFDSPLTDDLLTAFEQ